jgi:hypothetical protein
VSHHARGQACRVAYFDRLATWLYSDDRGDGVDGGSVIGVPREGLSGEGRAVVSTADYGQSGREPEDGLGRLGPGKRRESGARGSRAGPRLLAWLGQVGPLWAGRMRNGG